MGLVERSGSSDLARTAAAIAVVAGAAGSVALVLYAGHRNPSSVLMALFVVWVLAPFIALGWTNMISRRWSAPFRAALYTGSLLLTAASLAVYGMVALGPPRARPAFFFLVVPLVSLLLIATTVSLATRVSRRRSRGNAGA